MKFKAYVIFAALWAILVYSPLAHWVWGGGWLAKLGALDFAGGHGRAHRLGGRRARLRDRARQAQGLRDRGAPSAQHPDVGARRRHPVVRLVRLQRRLGARVRTARRLRVPRDAPRRAAGLLAWNLAEVLTERQADRARRRVRRRRRARRRSRRRPASSSPLPALADRRSSPASLCYFGLRIKTRFGFDDALDVVGVHGVGGTVGALLTGVFATTAVNAAGANGLLAGNPALLVQAGGRASWRRSRSRSSSASSS